MGMLGREPSSAQLAYLGSCARSTHELRQSTKTGSPEIFRKWVHEPAITQGAGSASWDQWAPAYQH